MSDAVDDAGDSDALAMGEPDGTFEAWYRSEYGRLVAVLVRLGADHDTANDVAAEAFSRALTRWNRVRSMASPAGWTYLVAFNLLRRQARRAALERRLLLRRPEVAPETSTAGVEVWDAVRALPERQRTAIVLRYLLDLPYAEIAAVMGVAEGTVAATLSGARQHLRRTLGEAELQGVEDG